jgi:hypothetical protein
MHDSEVWSIESAFDRAHEPFERSLICPFLRKKRGDVRPPLWCHPAMHPSVVDLFNKAADLPEEDRATLAGLLIEFGYRDR